MKANLRFGLARAREYSESIGLIRGNAKRWLVCGVRRNWQSETNGVVRIIVFTGADSVLATPFPLIVAAPEYILGHISPGTLM